MGIVTATATPTSRNISTASVRRSVTDSTGVFGSESAEHLLHGFSAAARFFGNLRARLQQQFGSRRVVSRLAIPAMFGAVDGPPQRGTLEISVGQFQRRVVAQDF